MTHTVFAIFSAVVGVPFVISAAASVSHGRICLAPVPDMAREADLESGNRAGYQSYKFSVQVDEKERVGLPVGLPAWYKDVKLGEKHLVNIREGDRLIESFWFTFEKRGANTLCLSYTPFHQTWLLERPSDRPWCHCECTSLSYEPVQVQLTGRLITVKDYGPPNWGDDPANDQPLNTPVLVLDLPINVKGDPTSDTNNRSFEGVERVQVQGDFEVEEFVNRRVVVTGTLFQAHTGWHKTDVLISAESIEIAP